MLAFFAAATTGSLKATDKFEVLRNDNLKSHCRSGIRAIRTARPSGSYSGFMCLRSVGNPCGRVWVLCAMISIVN